jgi:acetyl-CoA carboxylase biotin carboxylase subunit
MFKKVLIANRGEIALRVIRTCKEMGIKSVAVYSDADKDSLPVKYADEAQHIGPPLSRKSYLSMERIIEAAQKAGAEAIHPGYGFLAENAAFAEFCDKKGCIFVGPSATTHRLTGEKIASRKIAASQAIAILPGSEEAISSLAEAVKLAGRIGYPVIVKASGGGGGRGMKVACSEEELKKIWGIARGEALAAFKNPDLFIEKYLAEPRHIEFQILGDKSGNYVHLGERECSIQKRYQKLIEESPSPFLDDELRKKMGETAIRIMRSVGYTNAGTVEFLLDARKNFYFNEINSRLQVEHPVTEMVTGIDLVKQQFMIAAGRPIEFKQDEVRPNGWAIECRINAEDPDDDFRPSPGKIKSLVLPGGLGVRVDTHLYADYEVPPFYDSLVGKLIVWGKDRPEAINRMKRALGEFCIEGLKTTLPFHRKVIENQDFVQGNFSTSFLKKFDMKGKRCDG